MSRRPWEGLGGHNLLPKGSDVAFPNSLLPHLLLHIICIVLVHLPTPQADSLTSPQPPPFYPPPHLCSSSPSHPTPLTSRLAPPRRITLPQPPLLETGRGILLRLLSHSLQGGGRRTVGKETGGCCPELRTRCSKLDGLRTICHHLNLDALQPPIVMLILG